MSLLNKIGKWVPISAVFLVVVGCNTTPEPSKWNDTVKRVSSGVVSIQTDVPISFDGKWNRSSYATGFIVDKKRGIILTNRHVVTPGPVTAKAILVNNEEIDLTPLYIDPVHDFGFYSYQPADIKHIDPHQFTLKPERTHVGQEIRIIGNDAGQKLSILDGTISRLDRPAPRYGKGKYNDFNTFYIQAATASTGGSSGSPVIDVFGHVMALNAGSQSKSANAFFLPLDRVKLALEKIQLGETIKRGTIQATYAETPYAELNRLGLPEALQTQYRTQYPDLKGLMVIESIIPESSAAEHLAVGDILLSVNDKNVISFNEMEDVLNAAVGKTITLQISRGGESLSKIVKVDDLNDITPSAYLEFDSSIFHNLSYQQARHFNRTVNGVYVAYAGSALRLSGIDNFDLITEINGVALNDIEQLKQLLQRTPSGSKLHVRYLRLKDPINSRYALVEVNRRWFEQQICQKNDELGYWPCEQLPTTADNSQDDPKADKKPQTSSTVSIAQNMQQISKALVQVQFTSPYSIQGRAGNKSGYGTGVIVDAQKGWVVVDRTVAISMLGDVKLVFANRLEVNGKVEYIHPLHNLALVSYPVEDIKGVEVTQVNFTDERLAIEQDVVQMGLNYEGVIEYRRTNVDLIQELWLPDYNVPQYLERNLQGIFLVNANNGIDGILINDKQQVAAMWATFAHSDQNGKGSAALGAGLHGEYVNELLALASGEKDYYSLEIGLTHLAPVNAIEQGVDSAWVDAILKQDINNQKVLAIYNIVANTPSEDVFKRGDILLAVNDVPVSSFRQVELLAQAPLVKVTFARRGEVIEQNIQTTQLYGQDISQVFHWAGLYLHAPHRAAQVKGIDPDGIYVASYNYGSPATRYSVYAMRRIVEIDGQAIISTSDFVNAVKGKQHGESVLLKTKDFNNNIEVTTLRLDSHYWPFYEISQQDGKWQRFEHE